MYIQPTAKQIAHMLKKVSQGTVFEYGTQKMWQTGMMKYYKAHLPKLVNPSTSKAMWQELGFDVITNNRKADVVVVGPYLSNTLDIEGRLKDVWNKSKVDGRILITSHTGLNSEFLSLQPNFWIKLQQANPESLGISYFYIGDTKGQYASAIDTSKNYGHNELLNAMYKFVECRELITNITLVKLSTKELICPK